MIEVCKLNKKYGHFQALCDLSFSVPKGTFLGLLGPNGAGKTTTMRIMSGAMAPSSGVVKIDGVDVFENPLAVKKKLGYLPDIPPLYEELSVKEYLQFVGRLKGLSFKEAKKMTEECMESVFLKDVALRPLRHLSRGYRQRVGIAQALVSRPQVIILDEPTIGLDPKQVSEVRELLKRLKGKVTLVLSTHILSEAQAICQEVVILYKGVIRAKGVLSELSHRFSKSLKVSLKTLKASDELTKAFKSFKKISHVEQNDNMYTLYVRGGHEILAEVSQMVVEKKAGLLELKPLSLNLEDVFLEFTKKDYH